MRIKKWFDWLWRKIIGGGDTPEEQDTASVW